MVLAGTASEQILYDNHQITKYQVGSGSGQTDNKKDSNEGSDYKRAYKLMKTEELNIDPTDANYYKYIQESKQLLLANKELLDSLAHQLLLEN